MNWEAVGAIADAVGALGVIATLAYLAVQIRSNTSALSAQSRHSISEFALQFSMFRAEHAKQYAKIASGAELSDVDREFLYWSHMQICLHAETYFHHFKLGLMPQSHWNGYLHYITGYIQSRGFMDYWIKVGPGFSEDFRAWINNKVAELGLDAGTDID